MPKLLSLFDGSGGFPLAGAMCGITPIAASEIEPYPIAVTKGHFPKMKHLGDISKINGADIEPVDVITFGSPCQDLSVAGKRAGLKHESNGDDETTRSGLFMEAVRIIKEMRRATNGEYPKFALWENVPGAFSSNKGEDFRIVLEELIKIVEPSAAMPPIPKKGWACSDSYRGDGWSLAYRVLDAQYWGVPQRRRRIYLVLHLTGECAGKVLFERQGLRGYFAEGRTPWQGASEDTERGIGTDDTGGVRTVAYPVENHPNDSRVKIREDGKVQSLTSRMGTGGGNVPLVLDAFRKTAHPRNAEEGQGWAEATVNDTLNVYDNSEARTPTLVVEKPRYIVRRLTPTECARLQGFPDHWGEITKKKDFTDEEYRFWLEVRNTHAAINGKTVKDYTKKQMLTWYNKLHTDSAEYKMWGNGIALPTALYVMQGISEELHD